MFWPAWWSFDLGWGGLAHKDVRKFCCLHWHHDDTRQCQWWWWQLPKKRGCTQVWICQICILSVLVWKYVKQILSNNRCELKMWELMTHSLSSRFLDRVRIRLEGRPQDYSDFLNIMRVNSLTSATSVLLSLWSSIIGAEVRISEHKLCHRKGLSPISGNFNPTSSSILCKLILPKSRPAILFAEDSQNAIHNFYSQDFFSLYLTNHYFPNFIPGSKWYLHFLSFQEFSLFMNFLIFPGFSLSWIFHNRDIFSLWDFCTFSFQTFLKEEN